MSEQNIPNGNGIAAAVDDYGAFRTGSDAHKSPTNATASLNKLATTTTTTTTASTPVSAPADTVLPHISQMTGSTPTVPGATPSPVQTAYRNPYYAPLLPYTVGVQYGVPPMPAQYPQYPMFAGYPVGPASRQAGPIGAGVPLMAAGPGPYQQQQRQQRQQQQQPLIDQSTTATAAAAAAAAAASSIASAGANRLAQRRPSVTSVASYASAASGASGAAGSPAGSPESRTLEFVGSTIKTDINQKFIHNGHRPRGRLSEKERAKNEQMANLYSQRNQQSSSTIFSLKGKKKADSKKAAITTAAGTETTIGSLDGQQSPSPSVKKLSKTKSPSVGATITATGVAGGPTEGEDYPMTDASAAADATIGSTAAANAVANNSQLALVGHQQTDFLQLTPQQEKSIRTVNSEVAGKSLTSNLIASAGDKVPDACELPEFPSIPEGYVPMLMSPQGLLIPMQYSPVNTGNRIVPTARPVWHGDILGSTPSTPSASHAAASADTAAAAAASSQTPSPSHLTTHSANGRRRFTLAPRTPPKVPTAVPTELKEETQKATAEKEPESQQLVKKQKKTDSASGSGAISGSASTHAKPLNLTGTDKLAATRICIMSKDCYERAYKHELPIKVEVTQITIQHKSMVDYYIHLGTDTRELVDNFARRRDELVERFNSLDGEPCDDKSDVYLHGLERDMREFRDYEIVRQELFDNYQKERLSLDYQNKVLEIYSSLCLDYTTRLVKFKKLLLKNRHILTSKGRDQLYQVNSSKGEKLWRSFLNEEHRMPDLMLNNGGVGSRVSKKMKRATSGLGYASAYQSPPRKSSYMRARSQSADLSFSDDSSSMSSSMMSSSQLSRANRSFRGPFGGKRGDHKSNMEDLMMMLSNEDFGALTDNRSKVYDNAIINCEFSDVSDQSDLIDLIDFFKVKSILGELQRYNKLQGKEHQFERSGVHKGKRLGITTPLDETASDADRVRWLTFDEKEIRAKFTKAYPLPQGLTDKEIEDDLKELSKGMDRPYR